MKKVSFDYDGTLALPNVEEFAKELVGKGIEVWIVTSRVGDDDDNSFQPWKTPDWNRDLWETAERVGIPKEHVQFTSFVDKVKFIEGKDFIFHLDDDEYELYFIMNSSDPCVPLNVNHFSWRENCLEALEKHEKSLEDNGCCPNCGECENIHVNYDYYKLDRPVEEYLCNECGTYFKPKQV